LKELEPLCKCDQCPLQGLNRTQVWGNGPDKTGLVLVGEAPEVQDDHKGIPFIGRSGELLDATLEDIELDRDRCYVMNTVLCRPVPEQGKKNSPPTDETLACCYQRMVAEIRLREPKIIVTLGALASRTVLETNETINSLAGQITWSPIYNCWVIPTFHPASVLHGGYGNFDRIYDALQRAKRLLFSEVPFPKKVHVFREGSEWFYLSTPGPMIELADTLKANCREHLSIDLETNGFDVVSDPVLELGVSDGDTSWVLDHATLVSSPEAKAAWRELITDPNIVWVAHNKKFDQQFLEREGLGVPPKFEDTMCWAMALTERQGGIGLEVLSQKILNEPGWKDETKQYLKGGKPFSNVPVQLRAIRNARDTRATHRLLPILKGLVAQEGRTQFVVESLLQPAQGAFADAETRGVLIDTDYIDQLRPEVEQGLVDATVVLQDFAREAGFDSHDCIKKPSKYPDGSLDPRSPIQLRHCAYETMRLRPIVKSKSTKKPTTDKTFLEKHADKPFVEKVQFFRDWDHMLSVYVNGIVDDIAADGRIHPDILVQGAETGRLAIKNPPLQTIPKDDVVEEKGFPNLKRMFIPSPRMSWVSVDYKQLEVRIAWHYSGDVNLGNDCLTQDLHATMASRVTGKPLDTITKMDRFAQKFITFGMMYNRTAFSIALATGWPMKKARAYVDEFWTKYPDYHRWWRNAQDGALANGWLETSIGRRRHWNLIMPEFIRDVKNQAVNFPVQSLASDLNTYKFIELNQLLRTNGWGYPLFPVHDSIQFEIWTHRLPEVIPIIVDIMCTSPFETCATFEVDVDVGPSWGQVKTWVA